jgi:predicted ATP-grasp superfamily ATP-dependent carboligase
MNQAPPSMRKPRREGSWSRRRLGAIVIGGDYQGLGIVRSLGRQGIPVCVIDDEPSISRWSRYATHSVRVPNLRDEEPTVAAIIQTADRFAMRGAIVFPTRDETVAALARNRDRLSEHVGIATPGWECVKHACDKRETYRLARELEIPIPKTWIPRSAADLEAVDTFPAVVKPALKDHFVRTTGAKAWRVDRPEELVDTWKRAVRVVGPGGAIVQELVPGGPGTIFGYCALFSGTEVLGRMVVRYGRQHPPDFGRSATWVESVELAELDEPSVRFLREIGYSGLVEIEYIRDPRADTYRLLDVNARTWGYHSLGPRLGVDFPLLLYRMHLGEAVQTATARSGAGWVRLVTDVPTVVTGLSRGRVRFSDYVRSMQHARCESVFSMRDPIPSVAEVALLPHLYLTRSWRPGHAEKGTETA